jgi:hypoxanthine phosphoribosyltransferase
LGARITADYQGKNLILVGVLKGSVVFMADLMRAVDLPLSIDFMVVSSYGGGTKTSGVVRIIKDIERPLDDLDVLIVEDILDSGMTLSYLREIIAQKGAKSVRIATLLDKPERRVVKEIVPDYVGFTIPDAFVVGYGLDYDERYRNLPYVGILSPTVYE